VKSVTTTVNTPHVSTIRAQITTKIVVIMIVAIPDIPGPMASVIVFPATKHAAKVAAAKTATRKPFFNVHRVTVIDLPSFL
jgi:hypothetical protein